MQPCCKLCRFGVETNDKASLRRVIICHRFPPTSLALVNGPNVTLVSQSPICEFNGWCGEFAERPSVLAENFSLPKRDAAGG